MDYKSATEAQRNSFITTDEHRWKRIGVSG
jgi:hypothetical protein